jgi:hypothetical protein
MTILHITDSNTGPDIRCKVMLILEQNMKTQGGGTGIYLCSSFNLGARWSG